MKQVNALKISLLPCLMGIAIHAAAAEDVKSAFAEGSVNGELRSYHNYRNFKTKQDTSAYAMGINLRAATAPLSGFSVGGMFSVSNDLGTRSDNLEKDNPNLPADADVLSEAYVQYQTAASLLRVGRQTVSTPFANASDAFMIPITYEAVVLTHKTGFGLSLNALYLDRVKGRPDDKFADTSQFSASRYQVADATDRGVWVAGLNYERQNTSLQGWHYRLPEQFYLTYLQGDHGIAELAGIVPRLSLQLLQQQDGGDAILGRVDTKAAGIQLAASKGRTTLHVAWNHVKSSSNAFNGGGILAPFNFSTSPIFTNSMVQTMENSSAGDAYKLGIQSAIGEQISVSLSYASYERKSVVDTHETDADITFRFAGGWQGLSARLRVAVIGGDQSAAEMTEVRSQIQYSF